MIVAHNLQMLAQIVSNDGVKDKLLVLNIVSAAKVKAVMRL